MRAALGGALAALSLIAMSGCAGTGVQAPTEAPSASVSPEVQKLVDLVNSDTKTQLLAAADRFEKDHCEVHLKRTIDTPEMASCARVRDSLASLAGRLEKDLKARRPVPAEVDSLASGTLQALAGVRVTAAAGEDPELLTVALRMVRGELDSWSAVGG